MVDMSVFWHPHDVELIDQTDLGGTDQDTGLPIAPNEAPATVIDASIETGETRDTPSHGTMFDRHGITLSEGEAVLWTPEDLDIHDRIRVHHDDTGDNFTTYRITEIRHKYAWFGDKTGSSNDTNEYVMEREDN